MTLLVMTEVSSSLVRAAISYRLGLAVRETVRLRVFTVRVYLSMWLEMLEV